MRPAAEGPSLHPDGTMCLEGTSSVPGGSYRPCCPVLAAHLTTCANDIRYEYWPRRRAWFLIVADGTGDGVHIRFCPHCGAKLPRR